MPCQLAPWEVEFERKQAEERRINALVEVIDRVKAPRNVRNRLLKLAKEDGWTKARRCTRELCQAWRMLFEILDAEDQAAAIEAVERVRASSLAKTHRVYWEAHKLGDKANRKR